MNHQKVNQKKKQKLVHQTQTRLAQMSLQLLALNLTSDSSRRRHHDARVCGFYDSAAASH